MFKVLRPILSILIAIVIVYAFVRPMYTEIQVLQLESVQYEDALEEAGNFNRLLDSLIAEKNSFSASELERINMLVPNEIDEVQALVDIEALAENSNLEFGQTEHTTADGEINSGNSEGSTMPVEAEMRSITFNVLGDYEDFKTFLAGLERSLVLMEVTHISFGVEEEGITTYNVTVRLFGQPQSAGS